MRSSLYEVRIERLVDVGRVDIVPGFGDRRAYGREDADDGDERRDDVDYVRVHAALVHQNRAVAAHDWSPWPTTDPV
jgi:hypothetical protein